ncbi:MAG: hypothetical protein MAG453_01723 [Calditrichaeota bacterium]|nr:hypothetical protein [Calditrichota bacterium]
MLYGWFELEENDLFGLITTDGSGILQSQMSTGSWGTNSAIQLADGGYLGIFSDIYSSADTTVVHRFNAAGDLLWVLDYQYQPGHATGGETLYAVGDSAFVIGGTWEPEEGFSDTNMFLTKFLLPPTDFEVEVESYRQPLIVDPPDAFYWHGTLTNNTDEPATRDVWVVARGPDGSLSEPYALWEEIDVPAQGSVEADIRQLVPQSAPPGEYNYIVRAGDYPTHRIQDHLALTVTGDAQPEIPDAAGGGTTVPWFEKPARVGDVQR